MAKDVTTEAEGENYGWSGRAPGRVFEDVSEALVRTWFYAKQQEVREYIFGTGLAVL